MDAKGFCDGLSRLLTVSPSVEVPKTSTPVVERTISANGELPVLENGGPPHSGEARSSNVDETEKPTLEADPKDEGTD